MAIKKEETKKVVSKKETTPVKKETKKETAPAKKEIKADAPKKEIAKNYHISQRKEDGKWQVKGAGSEKALKLFDTQKDAIEYANKTAKNQDAPITIHKKDGKIRKQKY